MDKKRLILAKRAFPAQVAFREFKHHWDELPPLAGLFENPVVVLVPEVNCRGQRPSCISPGCGCTPRVKEYLKRVVEDIDGKQDLLNTKDQCAGSARACFSTISPTVADYCAIHSVVESKVLTSAWMESTAMYGPLCELLMQTMSVRKALRVDHSANATQIRKRDMFVECNDYAEAHTKTRVVATKCISMFGATRVVSEDVEAVLARPCRHWAKICELLLLSSTSKNHRFSRSDFMTLFTLEPNDSESLAGFSQEEYELLRQVRKEQTPEKCSWLTCDLVTTITFNLAAESNTNSSVKLRQRSYTTIVAKLKVIADEKTTATKQYMQQTDDSIATSSSKNTNGTKLFRIQLFQTIRESKLFTGKKNLFIRVYNFVSCICDGIWPKSEIILSLRWGAMKRASNRGASLKIKLRVPQDTIFSSRKNQQVIQPRHVTLNSLKALNQIHYWNILSLTMDVQSTTQTHCQ
ncbi:hypothetical protein PHMEG_00014029 [Phytophthora megakarya]|uniref:Uncharacterized protein n=1 Tax=Phytophthora megakarya TaxID=4795 RepID=A0A225W5X4_9STRA|nr:hypothetical protein PHMEG_00014029 [Phytophthora megakarya]